MPWTKQKGRGTTISVVNKGVNQKSDKVTDSDQVSVSGNNNFLQYEDIKQDHARINTQMSK